MEETTTKEGVHHASHHVSKSGKNHLKGKAHYLIAFILFLAIAGVIFYPISLHMGNTVPGSGGDTYQNLWGIWWVNYALFTLHNGIYSSNLLFWPVGVNLIYQTMSPLASLITGPFQLLGVVPAYDILFLLGFALSGLGMYVLSNYLVKNKYAAFIAGVIFTFSAVHIAQSYGHIEFLVIMFIPLFVYFMMRVIDEGVKLTNTIGMGLCFGFATLAGSVEQSIMLILLFILVIIITAVKKEGRKKLVSRAFAISMVLFLVFAFIAGAWAFIPIIKTITTPGGLANANYLNTPNYNALWSDNLLSFFIPSYYNTLIYGSGSKTVASLYVADPTERIAYIGYIALALLVYGIYKTKDRTMYLWFAGFAVFAILALGPVLQVGSSVTGIPSLYAIYHAIPGLNVVREPGRFDMVAMMIVALLAGFGAKELLEKFDVHNPDLRHAINPAYITLILVVLVLIESNGLVFGSGLSNAVTTKVSVPPLYKELGSYGMNSSVLQIPAFASSSSSEPALYPGKATYYTSITHRPLVGGYVTRANTSDELTLYNIPFTIAAQNLEDSGNFTYVSPVLENYTAESLMALYNYNTAFVILDKEAYTGNSLNTMESYLYDTFGYPLYNDNTTVAFQTGNAIGNSVFKYFVAFPLALDWQPAQLPYNGTIASLWIPLQYGEITLLVPYTGLKNATPSPGKLYTTNTVIGFGAVSINAASQVLSIETTNQEGRAVILGNFNVTNKMRRYNLSANFSVENPTQVFFVANQQTNSTYIGIYNITFSEGK